MQQCVASNEGEPALGDKRATILIVDDEPLNLRLLGSLLRDEHEILVATNGREAMDRACSETPLDLILLDVMMPGMDGYQVCRALKADPCTENIPVIFVTVKDDVAAEAEGLAIGAVDYITKPVSPPIVQARVRTHLKLKAMTDRLTHLSALDGLTGLSNRRQLDKRLDEEWRRITRSGGPFSIVMMDVDHFKQYNDDYGHSVGDECLRQVAITLQAVVHRSADMVARYGGEEFVALLPAVGATDGLLLGERFRQQVEALGLEHRTSSAGSCVTISVGVATCIPKVGDDSTVLLEAADRMLYDAKKSGRNRVMAIAL